jgi:hypothetical protein
MGPLIGAIFQEDLSIYRNPFPCIDLSLGTFGISLFAYVFVLKAVRNIGPRLVRPDICFSSVRMLRGHQKYIFRHGRRNELARRFSVTNRGQKRAIEEFQKAREFIPLPPGVGG